MYALPPIRHYQLSKDGVATIKIIGEGPKGAKSFNLIVKAPMLEECGFLFPRRNLVIKQSILLEGLRHAGLKQGWDNELLPWDRRARQVFISWAVRTIWPVVENIFEGRAFFVRSNAPGDSLGRGVYSSVPFVNRHRIYAEEHDRPLGFAHQLLSVVESYFSETAAAFRELVNTQGSGINVMLCQFIGRPGEISGGKRILVPFMSAVVKSTIVQEHEGEGLIRFEYGMGKGATSGRTLLYHTSDSDVLDPKLRFETISGKERMQKMDVSAKNMNAIAVDVNSGCEIPFQSEHEAVFAALLKSAYPFMTRQFVVEGYELLKWLAHTTQMLEVANQRPVYLEAVVSSFKEQLRWFVVQVSDYDPVHQLPNPPDGGVDFVSDDFYGHGEIKGNRNVFIFGKDSVKNQNWKEMLHRINSENKGFVVLIPQQALTGIDLTELSGGHFSNAAAVLEYRLLGSYEFVGSVHREGPSSEHFEQVMRDFNVLFIPVLNILSDDDAGKIPSNGIAIGTADVALACDSERGFAWGRIRNLVLEKSG